MNFSFNHNNQIFDIRPINVDDAKGFFHLVDSNRLRLEDFFAGTVAKNTSLEASIVFIEEALTNSAQRIYFPFVITLAEDPDPIGFIDIKSIDWNIPKAEMGYFIDANYEGRGIISKAFAYIVSHCFEDLKM